MMDKSMVDLDEHFQNNSDHDSAIWGWNLLTEDPSVIRGPANWKVEFDPNPGAWGAVNRVVDSVRQVENRRMNDDHRMVVAILRPSGAGHGVCVEIESLV